MRAIRLFLHLCAYYLGAALIIHLLLWAFPSSVDYLPVGGAQTLLAGASSDPFAAIEVGSKGVSGLWGSSLWVFIAVMSALLISLPVCWTYIACRKRDEYDNSIVRSIIILPMLLTSIVLIVHNSLALAFSLAGIVGAVRFRNTLKSPMTVLVNFCYVILWATEFGVMNGSTRYMRRPYDSKPNSDVSREGD